jgi:single-strand DNA-binding protein
MANQVYLTDNITRDSTVTPTTTGMPMASLHLAAERQFQGDDRMTRRRIEFTDVLCFGDLVSEAVRLGVKGRPVAVDGSVRTRVYENGDGTKRYELQVVADSVYALEPRTPSRPQHDVPAQPAASGEHTL